MRRTNDPNINYMTASPEMLWCFGITEFKIDTQNNKFILTPIMRDRSEGLKGLEVIDATDMFEQFQRERR
jgi:hypothetical protein